MVVRLRQHLILVQVAERPDEGWRVIAAVRLVQAEDLHPSAESEEQHARRDEEANVGMKTTDKTQGYLQVVGCS